MKKSRDPWVTSECLISCCSPRSCVTVVTQHSTSQIKLLWAKFYCISHTLEQQIWILYKIVQDLSLAFWFGKQHGNHAYSWVPFGQEVIISSCLSRFRAVSSEEIQWHSRQKLDLLHKAVLQQDFVNSWLQESAACQKAYLSLFQ